MNRDAREGRESRADGRIERATSLMLLMQRVKVLQLVKVLQKLKRHLAPLNWPMGQLSLS